MNLSLENFDKAFNKIPEILDRFGYKSLRPGQEGPINSILLGLDTIAIMPTGGGKTLLAALPTVAMDWKTLVFSPLVALMRDQVQSMNRLGIKTACINSSQNDTQNYIALKDWSEGRIQMLYVAPERLSNEQFLRAVTTEKASFVVVDEAHTVSTESANFRPSYVNIGKFIEKFNPDVVLAMTATATNEILNDIKRILGIQDAKLCRYYVPRTNLKLSSSKVTDAELNKSVLEKVRSVSGSVIVYCQTVKMVATITSYLASMGESVTFYHGQITSQHEKSINMDSFMSGRSRICVATNAFGMGIDKPDIEAVIHTGPPSSIEAVSQEVGRAARDGRDAICHMFVTPSGLSIQEFLFNGSNPTGEAVRKTYKFVEQRANADGIAYVKTQDIVEATGEPSAGGALNFLQTLGCVERFKIQTKIYTIGDYLLNLDDISKRLQDVVSVVREYGTLVSESPDMNTYSIDLAFLVSKVGKTETTIKSKLNELHKENIFNVTKPFNGFGTKILRKPTSEEIQSAEDRRQSEWKKIEEVREYIRIPDKDKQTYITNYFELNN